MDNPALFLGGILGYYLYAVICIGIVVVVGQAFTKSRVPSKRVFLAALPAMLIFLVVDFGRLLPDPQDRRALEGGLGFGAGIVLLLQRRKQAQS